MLTENNPAVIYPAPACHENSGDGRDWCADAVFETCECGSEPVRYVIGTDFDRVTAERDALQSDLSDRDQRVDELEQLLTAMTFGYSSLVSAGYDRITGLGGDCDSPQKMLSDFPAYAKSIAILKPATSAEPSAGPSDEVWLMNPCKQGHTDVGAAGGVASCYRCDEKIIAATTEEAFALWNASHPKTCCGNCPADYFKCQEIE
ncbi:hypothetical protein EMIT0324P_11069 [Pseudomonas chlororaphis]|uniref:hypothetical protein n=1 Tax=Pseudomonas chlororaphis TaxID=587753 RepID=UPI0039E4A253